MYLMISYFAIASITIAISPLLALLLILFFTREPILGILTLFPLIFSGINLFAGVYLMSLKPISRLIAMVVSTLNLIYFGLSSIIYTRQILPITPRIPGEETAQLTSMPINVVNSVIVIALTIFALVNLIILLLPKTKLMFNREVRKERGRS